MNGPDDPAHPKRGPGRGAGEDEDGVPGCGTGPAGRARFVWRELMGLLRHDDTTAQDDQEVTPR